MELRITMKKMFLFVISIVIINSCSIKNFDTVDQIITSAISEHIFPGAVLLVGTADDIIYEKAYGHFTYADDAQTVTTNSIFDMASLTKVFATSMCMMKCIDSGLVDPEAPVIDYLPEFNNQGKKVIKVKHLLMHNSGLPAYTKAGKSRRETLNKIMNIEMTQSPETYKYSCLNFITLMRVVESVTGKMMWKFYREIYTDPMGFDRTMFSPPENLQTECLPTIGDSSGTHVILQGKVHDPLALSLEGYSGNAGLFSTAPELAAFCQLILNDGIYNNKPYIREETLIPFTTLQSGTRTYGWGVNNYKSSAGISMSETAIGHTGYTGTCVWIDREKDIFIIFLTNRVFPMDKKSVTPVRKAVNDAVVETVLRK